MGNWLVQLHLALPFLSSNCSGPKSPGLIILEHELANETVQAFMEAYPLIKQNGWNYTSVARLFDNHLPYRLPIRRSADPTNQRLCIA